MEIVIFDTNAYRNIATDKDVKDIETAVLHFKQLEQKNQIVSLMHPIVIKELLYHVAGERNSLHYLCVKALKAMFFHCGDNVRFGVLADFDLQISRFFFKVIDPNRERIDTQLGEIVCALGLKDTDHVLKRYQYNLKQIRAQIKETEDFFKNQLKGFIKKIDPNADSWSILQNDANKRKKAIEYFKSEQIEKEISLGYISMAYQNLLSKGLIPTESNESLLKKGEVFREIFQAPIQLYKSLLQKFVQPEFDMDSKSRENFVWDIHIMFTIGDHVVSGTISQLYLITSDNEMINAAKNAGFLSKVFSYPEYIELIRGRIDNYDSSAI